MPLKGRICCLLLFCLPAAITAAEVRKIAVRVEPPQEIAAFTLRSRDGAVPVRVYNGVIAVPADLPLPWSLSMVRFEAAPYTSSDLAQKRPWVIRELGVLRGRLDGAGQKPGARFLWLLLKSDADEVAEHSFTIGDGGTFTLPLPAGSYAGAVIGVDSATRIRSGIVVKPGQTTDLGALQTAATVYVSQRVVDERTSRPVAAARVVWDPPPDILNSPLIAHLYAQRWSSTTDRNGVAEIPYVGPIPHSVRWRIETKDYAPAFTSRTQLKETRRAVLPDVRLRRAPTVIVQVQFPRRDEEGLANCTLVAGEIRDPHSPEFHPVTPVPLREGNARFTFESYGPKRVWIENKAKRTIFYRDFEPVDEMTFVDLTLRPVDIHGRVTERSEAVPDSLVTLADPHNAKVILAQVATDEIGQYRLTTWQSGEIFLYTIGRRGFGPGKRIGSASSRIDIAGRSDVQVDLQLPSGGYSLSVIDDRTGAPVRATVDSRVRYEDGGAIMGRMQTDDAGRIEVSSFPRGTARLHIEAKGYRAADVEIAITEQTPAVTVRLERARAVSGKVVSSDGTPIPGALLLGGFSDVYDAESFYRATTNAAGEFQFETSPAPNTLFYAIAPGYALGIATLQSDRPTTIILTAPSTFTVALREDNRSPEKVYLVMVSPSGREFIPLAVMEELAQAGGMSLYQLCGSSVDGVVILPEFLPRGIYDFSIARRGGQPFLYQKIGAITIPLERHAVMTFRSP